MAKVNCFYCDYSVFFNGDTDRHGCPFCGGEGFVDTIDIQGTVAKMSLVVQKKLKEEGND